MRPNTGHISQIRKAVFAKEERQNYERTVDVSSHRMRHCKCNGFKGVKKQGTEKSAPCWYYGNIYPNYAKKHLG